MRIIKMEAENIKKLKVVEIKPDGAMVVVGGRNAQGKSSVLDAILVCLAGKKKMSPKMLRDGEKKGFVELDLGDMIVRRTFTESGGVLKITNKDGATFASPQAMLNKLVGTISFDPLEFTRLDSKKQVEVLREVTGLDFTELDAKRAELYEERTVLNREGKQLKAQSEEIEKTLPEDVPLEKISISEIIKEMDEARLMNAANESARAAYAAVETDNMRFEEKCKRLKQEFMEAKEELKNIRARQKELKARLDKIKDIDIEPLRQKLETVEDTNSKVEAKQAYNRCVNQLSGYRERYSELTDAIKAVDAEKQSLLEDSELPVEGLSFDEDGVALNGISFEQASSAEQLRVSVAIGLAANPKLRVLLIKDGSLLDESNLKIVGKMAKKADAQIWLERVGTGKEISVVMEDGEIRE